jgi:3,4-dihydroxyphenylacetate 2,3-dioxygenase
MGRVALAAKVTHVPSMYLSELPGPHHGCRKAAIDGHKEIARRARERGVDTFVVFDVHWLVNSGYHVNSNAHFKGVYTSHELPHFIKDMAYDYRGNPELGDAIAEAANRRGVKTRSHKIDSLTLEYATLVPMRYMNSDRRFKVVSVAAWCNWHSFEDSRVFGAAVREAIEASGSTAAVLASGSLSHRFQDNRDAEAGMHTISRAFYREVDLRVVKLWRERRYKEFLAMLPDYNATCLGEGHMHDTVMLFGLLGWDEYQGECEIITDYFPSSGTGQINAEFHL